MGCSNYSTLAQSDGVRCGLRCPYVMVAAPPWGGTRCAELLKSARRSSLGRKISPSFSPSTLGKCSQLQDVSIFTKVSDTLAYVVVILERFSRKKVFPLREALMTPTRCLAFTARHRSSPSLLPNCTPLESRLVGHNRVHCLHCRCVCGPTTSESET